MTEILTSIFDNYKSKIRNPFFGTIATVWLIRNWVIVFALFNFDKSCTMQNKINYILNYFSKIDFWTEFWINIKIAFATLLITFMLLAISRFITDLYFKIVEPRIIIFLDKKRVFTQIEKTRLENRILSLNRKLESRDYEIEKVDLSNSKLVKEKLELENQYDNTFKRISADKEHLESKITSLNYAVQPLITIFNDFDLITKRFSSSELKYFFKISDTDADFNLTNTSQLFVMLKEKLIVDIENKIVLVDNSYNPDELLNSKYQFTTFGKLFIGYVRSKNELQQVS